MIEIEMSRDIREFSPKVLGPFDKRQLVVLVIAVLVGVPLFMLLGPVPLQAKLIIILIVCLPILLCGWVKMFGMPLEVFVMKFIIPTLFSPRKKVYMTDHTYERMFTEEGKLNPYKPEPILRTIEKPKLSRKEKATIKAKLKEYDAVD